MGPPQGKRAPRMGPISIVIFAREGTITDWKQCHGSHGFHTISPQCGIKSPFSVSLICTVACRNPATCGTSPGTLTRRFAPTARAHRPPERICSNPLVARCRSRRQQISRGFETFAKKNGSDHGQNHAIHVSSDIVMGNQCSSFRSFRS